MSNNKIQEYFGCFFYAKMMMTPISHPISIHSPFCCCMGMSFQQILEMLPSSPVLPFSTDDFLLLLLISATPVVVGVGIGTEFLINIFEIQYIQLENI